MTLNVTIKNSNQGGHLDARIKTIGIDANGAPLEGSESVLATLKEGEERTVAVHSGIKLEITEIESEAPAAGETDAPEKGDEGGEADAPASDGEESKEEADA